MNNSVDRALARSREPFSQVDTGSRRSSRPARTRSSWTRSISQNDGQVTVKVVRPEHAQDPEFRRKFHRLAEISNALTHPNIASVIDWGEIELRGESTVFWVVEALGGGSLRDLLDRGRLLEPGQALVVGLEACRALDAAHQKGLFHTELTPSKMVFGADRRLRVVDFGMARLLAEPAWADAAAVPTHVARYASPEQALGLPIDAKTDVYALALVMIEAVTGSVPFAADSTVATLAGRVDKLLPVSADLGSLASVLERAGRPESAERFTAAEFGRALVQAAPRLPKPEPIPILATGTFDTTAMRRPTDPTGGVERPSAGRRPRRGRRDRCRPLQPQLRDSPRESRSATDVADVDADRRCRPTRDRCRTTTDADSTRRPSTMSWPTTPLPRPTSYDPRRARARAPTESERRARGRARGRPVPLVATEVLPVTAPDASTLAATTVVPTTPVSSDVDPSGELYDDEADRRRRGPVILLIVLLLAGLAALGYAGSLLLQTKSFEVPVLAGVPEDEALNQIAGNGWEIDTLRERSDSFPELDTVIRTIPGPGVELDEGEPFTLVLSDGPEFRTLPELEGLPFDAAIAQLAGLGLNGVEAPERLFSETVAAESVISWQVQGDADGTMQAGAQILPGETIVMTLSMGPEPRTVPDLSGQTIDVGDGDARRPPARVGAGRRRVQRRRAGRPHRVRRAHRSASSLDRDGTVTVQVSKGPDKVAFPDLEGLSFSDAQQLLIDNGFVRRQPARHHGRNVRRGDHRRRRRPAR